MSRKLHISIIFGAFILIGAGVWLWVTHAARNNPGAAAYSIELPKNYSPEKGIIEGKQDEEELPPTFSTGENGEPIGLRSAPRAKEYPKTETALVAFPFVGRVKTTYKTEVITWTDEEGREFRFPFKFYYNAKGVWIRAEYRGKGQEYYEAPLGELEDLCGGFGETIVGFSEKPPSVSVPELLNRADHRMKLENASKIVLEHVQLRLQPIPPNPEVLTVVMVKIWGVDTPWADIPDIIPRIRIVYFLDGGYQGWEGWVDDNL